MLHRATSGAFVSYMREFFGEGAAFVTSWKRETWYVRSVAQGQRLPRQFPAVDAHYEVGHSVRSCREGVSDAVSVGEAAGRSKSDPFGLPGRAFDNVWGCVMLRLVIVRSTSGIDGRPLPSAFRSCPHRISRRQLTFRNLLSDHLPVEPAFRRPSPSTL